jgi:hypothetical protein
MNTYYLHFPSQEVWKQAAQAVGVLNVVNVGTEEEPDMQEQWSYYTNDWAVDDIGVIYNEDGVYNQETGEEITPPTPIDGWHVNFKSVEPMDWSGFLINPQSPYRIFAGD